VNGQAAAGKTADTGAGRLKLCHVHLLSIMSGPQRWSIEFFNCLPSDRYELSVVVGEPGEFQRYLESRGIEVEIVPSLVREISLLKDVRALVDLVQLFRRKNYDIVHTHSSKPGVLARLAARMVGIRAVVHHVQGFAFHEFSSQLTRTTFSLIEALGARLSDHVIFVNDEEREWAVERQIVAAQHCCTIFNGADLATYSLAQRAELRQGARADLGIGERQAMIAYVGRLWEQKHPQMLVATLAELVEHRPELDPVLVIAGDGPMRDEVASAAEVCGLADRVKILGWRGDIPRIMAAADVLFLPSLWEGLPLTLVEAACMGTPAVATDIKGNREAIVEGETGLLVPAKDPVAAAAALARILGSVELRSAMSRAAAERGRQLYDTHDMARRVEQIYFDVLAQKEKRRGAHAPRTSSA
jgi:glycosyltransferase involved in cell wall biosynthesis